jgi:hypothetical protein
MAEKELDACARKVKSRVKVWPSARASQQVAQCRKKKGQVRKGEKGKSLRRWGKEKWKTTEGKDCGEKGAGGSKSYCRPSKVVSKTKTPTTRPSKKQKQDALFRKRAGGRAKSTKTPKR